MRLPEWLLHKPARLDRGRMYMCCMAAAWVTSVSMLVIGPIPNSTISDLSEFTQNALTIIMFVGTSFAVFGYARGPSRPNTVADVRKIQASYAIAQWAVPAVAASFITYTLAIFNRYEWSFWLSALSASLGIGIAIGSLWNAWDFRNEILRIDKDIDELPSVDDNAEDDN